jgi:mRNA interferase MazF
VLIDRGNILFVELVDATGREQQKERPCVVLTATHVTPLLRYPLLGVVPLTGTTGLGSLYPIIQPSAGNALSKPSSALVDQVRAIDRSRVRYEMGRVTDEEMRRIERGVCAFLGL